MTVFKLFVLYCKFFLVCYMACYVFFVILLLILIKFVLLIVASSISLNIRVVSLYYFLCELGFSVGYCRRLRYNRTFLVKVLSYVLGTIYSSTRQKFFVHILFYKTEVFCLKERSYNVTLKLDIFFPVFLYL